MEDQKTQTHYYKYKGKDYKNMKDLCNSNSLTSRAFRYKVRENKIIKIIINSQNRHNERTRT
jgi:hypothetical protein